MPDNIRALRGNPGKRPPPKRVKLAPVAPKPPSWLDREAAAEWRRVVPGLESIGVLATVDRAVVANYCAAWSKAVRAGAILDGEGLMTEETRLTKQGEPYVIRARHPVWQVYREATALATALAKELYLTPNARLRSTMPEAPEDGEAGILD